MSYSYFALSFLPCSQYNRHVLEQRYSHSHPRFPDPDWFRIETQPGRPPGRPPERALQTRPADPRNSVSLNLIGRRLATGTAPARLCYDSAAKMFSVHRNVFIASSVFVVVYNLVVAFVYSDADEIDGRSGRNVS